MPAFRARLLAYRAPLVSGAVAAALYALTLQTHVNGGHDPYVTDVGEIQNALPRWGTLHFTGYPLYSMTGSLLVAVLRGLGVEPAAGASAVSLLWAVLAVAVTAELAVELGARRAAAVLGALAFATATSLWVDASIAEVHSFTLLLSAASLLFAVRFGRHGRRRDLVALALVFSQGVMHMRAVAFLAPALAVLVWPRLQLRQLVAAWRPLAATAGLAFLPYLYMPLREKMGATWTFGQTSTWSGFWTMVLDTKADRIVQVPAGVGELLARARETVQLLDRDIPVWLLGVGLLAIVLVPLGRAGAERLRWREAAGLSLAWAPYAGLSLFIWEGRLSDALLAAKLPVAMAAGLGLALGATAVAGRWRGAGVAALALTAVALAMAGWRNYPSVVAVTRDRSIEATIATGEQAANPGRPLTLVVPWGHAYWALAYAKEYRGTLPGVGLVDHNADLAELARRSALVVLADTFYDIPQSWWEDRLGPLYPETYAPGLVELRTTPRMAAPGAARRPVTEDLAVASAVAIPEPGGTLRITVEWLALQSPLHDYSVAVHLVPAADPDAPPITTADVAEPVGGWYPASRWLPGQLVRDVYRLEVPAGAPDNVVRVTAYYRDGSGGFVNGAWVTVRSSAEPAGS